MAVELELEEVGNGGKTVEGGRWGGGEGDNGSRGREVGREGGYGGRGRGMEKVG